MAERKPTPKAPRRTPRTRTRRTRPVARKKDPTLAIVSGCTLVALGAVVGSIYVTHQPTAPAIQVAEVEPVSTTTPPVESPRDRLPTPELEPAPAAEVDLEPVTEPMQQTAPESEAQESNFQAQLQETIQLAEQQASVGTATPDPSEDDAETSELADAETEEHEDADQPKSLPASFEKPKQPKASARAASVQRLPKPEGSTPAVTETDVPTPTLSDAEFAFATEDDAKLREVTHSLVEGRCPGADGARGLVAFRDGDFPAAHTLLSEVEEPSSTILDTSYRAGLFAGRYDAVRAALEADPDADPVLRSLAFGPWHKSLPHAAEAMERITPKGHYRVMTDLGLTPEQLSALNGKLGEASPSSRESLIKRAKKKHRGLQTLANTMDKAYAAYDKLFGIRRACEVVPTVYLFSDRGAFDAFSQTLNIGSTENVLGFYMPRYRVLVFYDQGDGAKPGQISCDTQETLMHETFHQWLHLYVEDAPPWFNEGLAEYFGICKLQRSRLIYGLVPPLSGASRLSNIRDGLLGMSSEPWALQRVLTASQSQFMASHPAMNYAQSWSFVHYLASNRAGREKLRAYFQGLRSGTDHLTLFEQVFGDVPSHALETSWRDYVLRLKP